MKKHFKLVDLPVTNIIVTTAIGKKPTSVKKQVYLEIAFGTCVLTATFLVVPFLTSYLILGNDWLYDNKVIIDYKRRLLTVNDYIVSDNLVIFDRENSERVVTCQAGDITHIYVVSAHEMETVSSPLG